MDERLLLVGVISLIATVTSVSIVLKIQHYRLANASTLRLAWENTQKRAQQVWEIQQEKRLLELETGLMTQVQQFQGEWRTWKAEDAEVVEMCRRQHEEKVAQLRVAHQLARLPRIEDMPICEKPVQ